MKVEDRVKMYLSIDLEMTFMSVEDTVVICLSTDPQM